MRYTTLVTVMNPVGLGLTFLATGAFVVNSLSPTDSSESALDVGATTSRPVLVGTALSLLIDVGTLTVAVLDVALPDRVTKDVYADAVP